MIEMSSNITVKLGRRGLLLSRELCSHHVQACD